MFNIKKNLILKSVGDSLWVLSTRSLKTFSSINGLYGTRTRDLLRDKQARTPTSPIDLIMFSISPFRTKLFSCQLNLFSCNAPCWRSRWRKEIYLSVLNRLNTLGHIFFFKILMQLIVSKEESSWPGSNRHHLVGSQRFYH